MLEAILAKANPTGPSRRLVRFLSGITDEIVYDVSFRNTTSEIISLIFNSTMSIA